jgi:NADH pyrophosphatase NudC (nudix superfamily)
MDIGSIFIFLAVLTLVIFFITQPFFDRRSTKSTPINEVSDHELSALLAERDRVLTALQELDFDYTLGKIPEEDYPAQRARMLQYGAEVLRQIDELQGVSAQGQPGQASALSHEELLESSVAARRVDAARPGLAPRPAYNGGKVVSAAVAAPDDDLEVLLANRRRSRQNGTAGFCSKCGSALQKTDKFCPKCGTKVV